MDRAHASIQRVDLWPQDVRDVLVWWVLGCLPVGFLLLIGGARAAGAALAGSSICSFLAALLKRTYGGENLETLVHGAVILGSLGLIVFGLAGLALGTHAPLGRFPMALVPAIGTASVGTLIVLKIHAGAALPVRHSRASGGSKTPGSRRCLRSMSPSSPCCSWCRRGERRGHRGTTKRTTPSRTGWSVVPVVAGRRSSCRCHRPALTRRYHAPSSRREAPGDGCSPLSFPPCPVSGRLWGVVVSQAMRRHRRSEARGNGWDDPARPLKVKTRVQIPLGLRRSRRSA